MNEKVDQLLKSTSLWGRNTGWEIFRIGRSLILIKDEVVMRVSCKRFLYTAFKKNPRKRLNHFEMYVYTTLEHPVKGTTTLKRDVKTINAVKWIMYHPRIHSGKGSYIKKQHDNNQEFRD